MSAVTYKNPPLIEVVAEFQFKPSTQWDLVLPGAMNEKLRGDFPNRNQLNVIGGFQFPTGVTGMIPQIVPQPRVQFARSDGSALIQVGPNLLAINHLRPYKDWQTSFLPVLDLGWRAYIDAGGTKDIQQLKLRYINRIDLPQDNGICRYEDYLEFRPYLGAALNQTHGPFLLTVSYFFRDQRDCLSISLRNEIPIQGKTSFVLDFDYRTLSDVPAPDHLINWFNEGHGRISEVFENCINDKLRDLMGKA